LVDLASLSPEIAEQVIGADARVDAEQTAAAFSERLRDEIDIASVDANLSSTVRAALSPSSVHLWLREDGL
jgi:hypothetical protein